ncbi:hypothetical protein BD309DRAFT_975919 [Dichomitus squalens]|uniref:Uncharacterized protein n=1 Tax=Dichomitus squalens TaxID=114155 RepID=A0A4Q9N9Y0_9APHY|nr:hypothetical protein BD309DRAFT_975919 [Dichomitus squalens]TBU51120.1 hypothetical protein BD310DRAFT_942711 [Dichomitus squalens]
MQGHVSRSGEVVVQSGEARRDSRLRGQNRRPDNTVLVRALCAGLLSAFLCLCLKKWSVLAQALCRVL